ncbi:TY-Chap domain-containing protein [Nocardia nova]
MAVVTQTGGIPPRQALLGGDRFVVGTGTYGHADNRIGETKMTENGWARIREDMPEYLFDFGEDQPRSGNGIRLRDNASGHEVMFYVWGDEVLIKVPVPADHQVRDRLLSVLRSHRRTSISTIVGADSSTRVVSELAMWMPDPRWVTPAEEWTPEELARPAHSRAQARVARRPETALQWRTYWPNDPVARSKIAAAVIEVLRDGLEATPERLRYSTFDDNGPVDALRGITRKLTSVAPDRPSERGAAEKCCDWPDFVERLEWVLTTLPKGAMLTLSAPGLDRDKCFVQFVNDNFAIANESVMWESAGLSRDEFHQRMTRLGWTWAPQQAYGFEHPGWLAPRGRQWRNVAFGDVAQRTAATFRDVLGVTGPNEVTFSSWGHVAMSYLEAELGISRNDS